jgi:hypothetical protein
MFGFFRKPKASFEAEADLVYLTDEARAKALARFCRAEAGPVVLLSPFQNHAAKLQEALRQRGVSVSLQGGLYRAAAQEADAIPLLTLGAFPSQAAALSGGAPLNVLQVERHPLRIHDDSILPALAALPPGTRLRILHSLEDGIFQLFGAGLEGLLRKLDMGPDEVIEHRMVTSSILQAQEKLKKRVSNEIPADSFVAWREKNAPPRGLLKTHPDRPAAAPHRPAAAPHRPAAAPHGSRGGGPRRARELSGAAGVGGVACAGIAGAWWRRAPDRAKGQVRAMNGRGRGWIVVMGWAAVATAAPTTQDKLAAEAVFDVARQLMRDGKTAEACPKFAESYRLDPAVGVLLYLADCHERTGKLASAWLTWREAAAAARAAGQLDREKLSLERATALEPKLTRIQIDVAAANAPAGLVVTRDGVELGSGLWGIPVPVDPGDHLIEAKAPGRKPWSKAVKLGDQPTSLAIQIPPLELEAAPVAPPAASSAPAPAVPASSAPPAPPAPPPTAPKEGETPQLTPRAVMLGARLGGLVPVGKTGATASGRSSSLAALHGPGAALELDAGFRLNQHLTGYAWFGHGQLSGGSEADKDGTRSTGSTRQAVGVGVQVATRHAAQGGVGVFGEVGVLLYHRYQLREETTGAAGSCASTTTLAGNAARLGGGVHVPIGGGVLLTPFVTAEIGRFVQASYQGAGVCGVRGGDYGISQREVHACTQPPLTTPPPRLCGCTAATMARYPTATCGRGTATPGNCTPRMCPSPRREPSPRAPSTTRNRASSWPAGSRRGSTTGKMSGPGTARPGPSSRTWTSGEATT